MVSMLVSVCVKKSLKHAAEEVGEVIASTGAAERSNILDTDSGLWTEFWLLVTIFTLRRRLKVKIY